MAESFDLTTPMGRAVAMIIAVIAQLERERVGERRAEASQYLREVGRWTGGRLPYGYMAEPMGESGWQLVPDPEIVPVIEWAAEQIIARQSRRSVALALTAKGVPTPLGRSQWSANSLGDILRSPALKGYTVSKGEIVTGPDGLPVRREPVLSDETWEQVQDALAAASTKTGGVRQKASLLLRIVFCGQCGNPLYVSQSKGRKAAYYRCAGRSRHGSCREPNWKREQLEDNITGILLNELGSVPMMKKQVTPADNTAGRIKRIEQDINALNVELKAGRIRPDRYTKTVSMLDDQLEILCRKPSRELIRG